MHCLITQDLAIVVKKHVKTIYDSFCMLLLNKEIEVASQIRTIG